MLDRVVFISGSSRGIGASVAKKAASQGAHVILHGLRDTPKLRQLAQELNCDYVTCDVSDASSVQSAIDKTLTKHKHIDVLINCAGVVIPGSTLESSESEWIDQYKVNVLGAINLIRSVVPHMRDQPRSQVVNVSSIHGHSALASEGVAAYSASKAALLNLTVSLARELAPNINVNAVSPGFTLTDMSQTWPDHVWGQAKSNLLGRVATTENIADVILFFASEQSSFITGQALLVDGGYGISNR